MGVNTTSPTAYYAVRSHWSRGGRGKVHCDACYRAISGKTRHAYPRRRRSGAAGVSPLLSMADWEITPCFSSCYFRDASQVVSTDPQLPINAENFPVAFDEEMNVPSKCQR